MALWNVCFYRNCSTEKRSKGVKNQCFLLSSFLPVSYTHLDVYKRQPTDNAAYQSGATVTVLGQGTLKRDGYTFSGWNTQADGKGETYQPGETFTIDGNTTLYAVWTAETKVKVTYHLPSMTEYSDEVLVGGEVTLRSSEGLQKAGYTFLGWTIGKEEQSITCLLYTSRCV